MDDKDWVAQMSVRNEERITSVEKLLQAEVAGIHRALSDTKTSVESSLKSVKTTLQLQMAVMALLAVLAQAGITWAPVIAAVRAAAAAH